MSPPPADPPQTLRVDRWLDIACLCKSRSQAAEACRKNQVTVNGQTVKANRLIRRGDQVELHNRDWPLIIRILKLTERTVSRVVARTLYEDLSPPRPKLTPLDRIMRMPPAKREKGAGRPTKKERRRISQLKDADS